jgi:hypothetical protein
MSIWIPALPAGMTNRGVLLKVTEAPPPRIFKGVTFTNLRELVKGFSTAKRLWRSS